MKKYFSHISKIVLTLALVFVVSGFLFPQSALANHGNTYACFGVGFGDPKPPGMSVSDCVAHNNSQAGTVGAVTGKIVPSLIDIASDILLAPLGWLAILILQLSSLITYLAGTILNFVVQFTIVDMKPNLEKANVINDAWKIIRDVANMGFIFVLLYAAIKTILGMGDDNKKLIVKIIVIAILINFSLFFTKIVIDASNVLAVFFYDAIAPGALDQGLSLGLSGKMMGQLKITSLWDIKGLEILYKGKTMIIIGIMGSIVSLIAAFVFFAVAIMFVIRFVVLIFVLILSPIAFVASIYPGLESKWKQWIEALIGQAFFAPIYFMLTWIVIVVSSGLLGNTTGDMATAFGGVSLDGKTVTNPPPGSIGLLVNFIVIIALLITSLVVAKDWANKAGGLMPGISKLTSWATGAAGGATLGVAGRFGRNTVGRAGAAMGDSEKLKERAAKGGMGGMAARLALATGRRTGGASFDVRGSALGGTLGGGSAQKGGFLEARKQKAEAEAKFAGSLAPSAKTESKAKTEYEDAVKKFGDKSPQALEAKIKRDNLLGNKVEIDSKVTSVEQEKQKQITRIKDSEELKSAEVKEKSASDIVARLTAEAGAAEGAVKEEKIRELETAKLALVEIKKEAGVARQKVREEIEAITPGFDARKEALRGTEVLKASEARKENFAKAVEKSFIAKYVRGYNYEAAAQIRKGKSNKDKLAEAAAAFAKETAEVEAPPAAPAAATPITPTTSTPPTSPPTP